MSENNMIQQALNAHTTSKTFQKLATSDSWAVRCYVARNLNTPVEVLQKLATDENQYVRREVGRNPNSTEICRRLVMMTDDKQSLSVTP